MKIRRWDTGKTIFELECSTWEELLKAALEENISFSHADFISTDFRDADFDFADFRDADFDFADFREADFSFADFRDVKRTCSHKAAAEERDKKNRIV